MKVFILEQNTVYRCGALLESSVKFSSKLNVFRYIIWPFKQNFLATGFFKFIQYGDETFQNVAGLTKQCLGSFA